jgi:hypothetical protein
MSAYVDGGGRYALYAPENWSRTPDALGVSFEAPDRQARAMVHEVLGAGTDESAEAIARRYVAGAQALFQGIREVESGPVMVGDLPAFRQLLDAEVLTVPVKVELLALNTGEAGLVAVGASSAASEPAYKVLLTAMLSSFRAGPAPGRPEVRIGSEPVATRAAPTLFPTFTAEPPTATPTPTPTPTFTPTPTPTRTPTRTPTARVIGRPTATRPAGGVATAARPAGAIPAPILLAPAPNEVASGGMTFSWRWDGRPLAANEAFEVRLWKDGQPAHFGAAEPTRNFSLPIDVGSAYGVRQGGSGQYWWTVALVQMNPYQPVGPEAPPRPMQVQFSAGGGGGGGGGSEPTWTPPPP